MKIYITSLSLFFCTIMYNGKAHSQSTVKIDVDPNITKLIDYKKDIYTNKLYTIQIFSTLNPDNAERERSNFLNTHKNIPAKIIWSTPNYKIWVGQYVSRLEADRALESIKEVYADARVIQPKGKM